MTSFRPIIRQRWAIRPTPKMSNLDFRPFSGRKIKLRSNLGAQFHLRLGPVAIRVHTFSILMYSESDKMVRTVWWFMFYSKRNFVNTFKSFWYNIL